MFDLYAALFEESLQTYCTSLQNHDKHVRSAERSSLRIIKRSFSPKSSHPSVLRSSLLFDTVMFHPQECTSQAAAKSSANTSIFLLSFNVQVELSSLRIM